MLSFYRTDASPDLCNKAQIMQRMQILNSIFIAINSKRIYNPGPNGSAWDCKGHDYENTIIPWIVFLLF